MGVGFRLGWGWATNDFWLGWYAGWWCAGEGYEGLGPRACMLGAGLRLGYEVLSHAGVQCLTHAGVQCLRHAGVQ